MVNYFPSRYDSVRHAETFPIPPTICTGKRDKVCFSCTSIEHIKRLDGWLNKNGPAWINQLLYYLLNACVSLRRKTTLSSLVRDIDHLHQTGKRALSADGSKLYLTLGSLMRYAVFGSHTGLRWTSLWVRSWPLAST
ncbi:hypothetical protein ACSBR1_002399 [Camellia fascicularis]